MSAEDRSSALPYLPLLQDLHQRIGSPSFRALAARSGMSHTHCSDLLAGRTLGSHESVMRLARAMTEDQQALDEIELSCHRIFAPTRKPYGMSPEDVRESRMAAESELVTTVSRLVRERAQALKLLELALHLRMHEERAPGGNETWREFDTRCEAFLRGIAR